MLPLPAFAPALYLVFSPQLYTLIPTKHMLMEKEKITWCVCVCGGMRNQARGAGVSAGE